MAEMVIVGLAMGGPSSTSSNSSSSGEEDGDAEWKAAIQSIAAATTATFTNGYNNSLSNSSTKTTRNNLVSHSIPDTDDSDDDNAEGEQKQQPQKLKHYQIKAQKLLNDMLEKTLVIEKDTSNVPDDDSVVNEGGVRLFKNSTPGIVFDHVGKYIFTHCHLFLRFGECSTIYISICILQPIVSLSLLLVHQSQTVDSRC
ncbi:hypothetical protein CRYUN_Cryun17cG0111800 [Craigia yunnanensis]